MQRAKNVHQNILTTIGNTPMIKMQNMTQDFPCPVFAKVEYFNPGHSVKDRMALRMIEDAEREGQLKPGVQSLNAPVGIRAWDWLWPARSKGTS